MNTPNAARLYNASCMALIVTAMAFAIRGAIMSELGREFGLSGADLGWIAGAAFWGTMVSLFCSGPLCDVLGMRRLMWGAWVGHALGTVLTVCSVGFWSLFFSTVLIGVANGFVEGATNPLVATLYPEEKTKKLNQYHAWWPGGIAIGGLAAYLLQRLGAGWQILVAIVLLPTVIYGVMFFRQSFPATERVASGVSTQKMFAECLRPLFLYMVLCMFLTGATETGTNQFIPLLLENSGIPGILVLVWVTGIMMVARLAVGPMVRLLTTPGLLLFGTVFTAIGLYGMSYVHGVTSLAVAAVYAVGICYFWPTMLGFVSERLPASGAMGMAVIGSGGMLSMAVALPLVGGIYDQQLAAALPSGTTVEMLQEAAAGTTAATQWAAVQFSAGSATLRHLVVLPAVLIAAFTFLVLQQRGKGVVKLEEAGALGVAAEAVGLED